MSTQSPRRCSACQTSLPRNAGRCPSCRHQEGDVLVVELGRQPARVTGRRSRGAVLGAALAFLIGGFLGASISTVGGSPAVETLDPMGAPTTSELEARQSRVAGCGSLTARAAIELCYEHGWEAYAGATESTQGDR